MAPSRRPDLYCFKVVGLVCVVMLLLTTLIAMLAPYWIIFPGLWAHRGLIMACTVDKCDVTDQLKPGTGYDAIDDVLAEVDKRFKKVLLPIPAIWDYPEWYMATQGLMSVGLALGLIALLIATLSLCCTCHKCNPHPPISGLLACAGIAMAIGCVVFGVKANQSWSIKLEWDSFASGRFGWSFWVGVAASVLSLLTSGIYGCIGRSSS